VRTPEDLSLHQGQRTSKSHELRDAFPRFASELERLLAASEGSKLSKQIEALELVSRCGCGDSFCSTFYVSGGRSPLTTEQQRDRGQHERTSLDLDASEGLIVVDTDYLDRIVSVEVLHRPDVEAELAIALEQMRHTQTCTS
jgi:hypothetical protein